MSTHPPQTAWSGETSATLPAPLLLSWVHKKSRIRVQPYSMGEVSLHESSLTRCAQCIPVKALVLPECNSTVASCASAGSSGNRLLASPLKCLHTCFFLGDKFIKVYYDVHGLTATAAEDREETIGILPHLRVPFSSGENLLKRGAMKTG